MEKNGFKGYFSRDIISMGCNIMEKLSLTTIFFSPKILFLTWNTQRPKNNFYQHSIFHQYTLYNTLCIWYGQYWTKKQDGDTVMMGWDGEQGLFYFSWCCLVLLALDLAGTTKLYLELNISWEIPKSQCQPVPGARPQQIYFFRARAPRIPTRPRPRWKPSAKSQYIFCLVDSLPL